MLLTSHSMCMDMISAMIDAILHIYTPIVIIGSGGNSNTVRNSISNPVQA